MAKMIILEVAFSTASSIDVVVIPLSTNKCLKIFGKGQCKNYYNNPECLGKFILMLSNIFFTTKLPLNIPSA